MGSSDEWSEFQEIIDSTPELDMCVDPRVYGGGNRYQYTAGFHVWHMLTGKAKVLLPSEVISIDFKDVQRATPSFCQAANSEAEK